MRYNCPICNNSEFRIRKASSEPFHFVYAICINCLWTMELNKVEKEAVLTNG